MSLVEISLLVGAVVFVLFCGLVAVGLVVLSIRKRRNDGAPSVPFAPSAAPAAAPAEPFTVEHLRRLKNDAAKKREDKQLEEAHQKIVEFMLDPVSTAAPKA